MGVAGREVQDRWESSRWSRCGVVVNRSVGRGFSLRQEDRERKVRLCRSLRERGERTSRRGRAASSNVVREGRWAREEGSRWWSMFPDRDRERRLGRGMEGGRGWINLL